MATIFIKNPASGDACLVLEPREQFKVNFDFKNDWQEIRFGAFISLTTAGNLNEAPITENVYAAGEPQSTTNHTFIPQNIFSYGFKDAGGKLPLESGALFAGFMLPGIQTTHVDNSYSEPANIFGGTANTVGCFSGISVFGAASYPGALFRIAGPKGTGLSEFASYNCISIRRTNGYSGIVYFNTISTEYTDVSIANLRRLMQTANVAGGQVGSGWFPPELNCIFLYSPFSLNRVRLHAVAVEKYR